MATKLPLVVDLSHHNTVLSFADVYAAGIRGVIHKASQGATLSDRTYAKRRPEAIRAGLLWGAYCFGDSSNVRNQVSNFLRCAAPDENTLLALDWEPNGRRTMTLEQAKEWLALVFEKTGQRPLLYSGSLVKEQLKSPDSFLSEHRLWIPQYGPRLSLPKGWDRHWLWQYTGDGKGPEPHSVNGIKDHGIDLNEFGGTDLASEWVHRPAPKVVHLDGKEYAPLVPDQVARILEGKGAFPIPAADPPKDAPKAVSVDAKVTPKDLVSVSRKAFRLAWLKRVGHGVWISLSLDKFLEWMGVAQNVRQQVGVFVSDNSVVLAITAVILSIGVVKSIEYLMADDVNAGRATPSGMTPKEQ